MSTSEVITIFIMKPNAIMLLPKKKQGTYCRNLFNPHFHGGVKIIQLNKIVLNKMFILITEKAKPQKNALHLAGNILLNEAFALYINVVTVFLL